MKEIIIKVKNMECHGCENRICNVIKNIEGVDNVNANYNNGIVKIIGDERLNLEDIKNKIQNLGFPIIGD